MCSHIEASVWLLHIFCQVYQYCHIPTTYCVLHGLYGPRVDPVVCSYLQQYEIYKPKSTSRRQQTFCATFTQMSAHFHMFQEGAVQHLSSHVTDHFCALFITFFSIARLLQTSRVTTEQVDSYSCQLLTAQTGPTDPHAFFVFKTS